MKKTDAVWQLKRIKRMKNKEKKILFELRDSPKVICFIEANPFLRVKYIFKSLPDLFR